MAQELDDGEFWLPSEFLTDDDLLMDFKTDFSKTKRGDDFPLGFCNSDLSSPVESVMGSTETESDEDDFISGLTRKLAHTTLHNPNFSNDHAAKVSASLTHLSLSLPLLIALFKLVFNFDRGVSYPGSPQSTLCGFKPGSSQSSPKRVSSPPESKEVIGWDLLYAAAGEVVRMRMIDETAPFRSNKPFSAPLKPASAAIPVKTPTPASAYYPPNHEAHLAFLQLQATHFQRMKQQHHMMKSGVWGQQGKMEYHQFQNQSGKMEGEMGRSQGLSMASWPTLQQSQQQPQQQSQQPGSGMRAVFLGETGAKKERTGTGVFLPRRFGTAPAENRKKPVCSTVLLPDRVVHALNLNLDAVEAQPHLRCNRNFSDAGLNERNIFPQQRRSQMPQPAMNQELRLPQGVDLLNKAGLLRIRK
ncbi:uncharacterized protein LOC130998534 [Salvia miltiorrhiza]|uniref:uncharacterized protein LOC130998534 n=1 Tax=Salvia miltiorrhiza TaxID=226208 RepID=UPI0025AC5AB7|nr:uncharacterized protein LOC130998534 [Salvia miltiorrhiza]